MILTPSDILTELQGNKPLSLTRIGDGEGIILNALSSVSALQLANQAVLYRQMGYYPSVNDIEVIRANLIDAYAHADIIGLPMHTQETNKHWTGVKQILDENIMGHTTKYCSVDIGYDFLNAGYFDELLKVRERINYVSCRYLDEGLHKRYNIKTVNRYGIAPESKFTSGYDGDVHYPTQFNKIHRWMDVVIQPLDILLVGAGVIGKIYCNYWRDRGGIAFDIGSVMDEWAGFVTRGPERGLDKVNEDLKYKL